MAILNFIINEIFGQGSIFLSLIALIGLLLQKKSFSEVVRGTLMTAIGFFVLNTGTGLITGNSIDGIINAFNTLMPGAGGSNIDIGGQYGTQIGIVMILAFAINLLVARFTPWKSVFLTGHMLYWFPFVFIAAGVDAGLTGAKLIILAAIFTALYMIVAPNLMRPLVKDVTGKDDFTIGHPTTTLSV
ncbi:MAG: PTS ascorbate transporter subunit IIC, partial [Erysipelotrichaceae bacterium]|nr:PTS ascorbate transporter subunit IIC [Erysipelotrichaceae bacterium]